jgi:hypothetical protein
MREQRDREMAAEERDLGDIVLSWWVPEIMNDDLHKGQVLDRSFGRRSWFRLLVRQLPTRAICFYVFFWVVIFRVRA